MRSAIRSALEEGIEIFIVLEMDRPLQGLVKIPSVSLRSALAHIGR